MTFLQKIDRYYWLFLGIGIVCGFLFPNQLHPYEGQVDNIIMGILFLLFLKVDIFEIIKDIKKPFRLLYILLINMLLTPIITYYIFIHFGLEIASGFVLLAALPAGVTAPEITDIMDGRTSLSLTILMLSTLVSIVTIPLLFWVLFKTNMNLNYTAFSIMTLKLLLYPFVAAEIIKYTLLKKWGPLLQNYFNPLILALLSFIMMITIAYQAEYILGHVVYLLKILGLLFIAFILFQLIGYFSIFWEYKGLKLAVANSNMLINSFLGILLSIAFFPPQVTTIVVLSLIPWSVLSIAQHWYKRYLP